MMRAMNTTYLYQKEGLYFAQFAAGLETLGSKELESLGAFEVKETYCGAHFKADQAALYRINYCSRLASRILAPLLSFDCHSDRYLYKTAENIDWPALFSVNQTFAILATVSNSNIRHSKFAAQRLKDAIADRFRKEGGERPSVDLKNPDISIHLHVSNNRATISLDTSGRSLHKRGYRQESVSAPMQETLAAAIVQFSQWDGTCPFVDPMCGSGTLLAEAFMAQARIPSGYLHPTFAFRFMPDFDAALWKQVKAEQDALIRPCNTELIQGSDRDSWAVDATKKNLAMFPGGDAIVISKRSYQDIAMIELSVIVCNPPYGIRLEKDTDMPAFMKAFGDFLKQRCSGSVAYVYFGNIDLVKRIGLRPAWKKVLSTGGLEGRLAKYEMFKGGGRERHARKQAEKKQG